MIPRVLQWTKTVVVHQPGRGGKEGKKTHTQKSKETDSLKCNFVVQALGEASGAAALWLSFLLPLVETNRKRKTASRAPRASNGIQSWDTEQRQQMGGGDFNYMYSRGVCLYCNW